MTRPVNAVVPAAPPAPPAPVPEPPCRWTFERKLASGYAAAAALVLAMVGLCTWQGARFVDFNRSVEHTNEVIDTVEKVGELVTGMESNQRGYWLLGDESIREQALGAIEAIPGLLQRLGELTSDNGGQGARLRELNGAVREKVSRTRKNLEMRQQQDLPTLLGSGYVTGAGQQLGLRVRAIAGEIIAAEQTLLRERTDRRRSSLHAAIYSLATLGALLGLLLTAIYKFGDAELRARRRLSHELVVARDEALAAARQKSEFLANMSHEIRTPLNGIVGMAGLLQERPLDAEAQECAGTIDTCAEALLSVINDVLDFSKLEAGRLSFAHAPFDLRETLDETLAILAVRAAAKNLALDAQVLPDVPTGLIGDSARLRQVLLNLLGNAVKFTERGEVALRVAPGPPPGSPGPGSLTLRFEVRDTGIGIAPEARGRLFQAFSQVDGSNTRRFGGTGLGLVISKELVARMAGEIGVESVPGVGSTFWFTARFTLDPDQADRPRPPSPAAPPALPDRPPLPTPPAAPARALFRVLLAEDNPINRKVALRQIGNLGGHGTAVHNGLEALARVEGDEPFDLILMDVQMPGMDGYETTRQLRARFWPAGIGPPVVAMTANAMEGDREKCLAAGMDDYLPKPVKQDALQAMLRRWLPPGGGPGGRRETMTDLQ